MKKLVTGVFTLAFLLVSINAFAQVNITDTESLNVSATVLGESIVIAEETPLAFGNVGTGTSPTIAYTSDDAGVMIVTGEIGANIYIQYPAGIALTGGTGNNLYVAFSVGSHQTTAASAGAYASEGQETLVDVSGQGTMRFFVGGQLFDADQSSTINANSSGTFTGTATFTAQYNSF
jgi:hypothetical protein